MYQIHHTYIDDASFRRFVEGIRDRVSAAPDSKALFHLFYDSASTHVAERAASALRETMPDALFVGCSSNANIIDGRHVAFGVPDLTVVCDVFENPTTQIEVNQFPLNQGDTEAVTAALLKLLEERPWVKAVEMLTTISNVTLADFCTDISSMRDDIVVFGGVALTPETLDAQLGLPYVFSSVGRTTCNGIVFAFYGGEDFHASTQTIIGWKQLGPKLVITRGEGSVMYELDGVPAFERYHHYLTMENDELFGENSLLFPFAIEHEGRMVIKTPVKVRSDGSITLSSDLASYHRTCRIAYGDPATILRSIKGSAKEMQEFEPQGIIAFSCAARLSYWGPEYVSRETLPFTQIAPTAGFYTGGEFARERGKVLQHNVTLVVAGMREGDATGAEHEDVFINETEFTRQMSIVNSLAAFVGVTQAELEDAYAQMRMLALTDGLTGIWNRLETERRIEDAIEKCASGREAQAVSPSVIMMDVDDFKAVNDKYGHKAGDDVLKGLGVMLRRMVDDAGIGCSGRWGGEEFMVLLPNTPIGQAADFAQRLCDEFAATDFKLSGRHTMSLGVAQAKDGETSDLLTQRADKALYDAKKNGKNCVVRA